MYWLIVLEAGKARSGEGFLPFMTEGQREDEKEQEIKVILLGTRSQDNSINSHMGLVPHDPDVSC
jgi:hypothetical protein